MFNFSNFLIEFFLLKQTHWQCAIFRQTPTEVALMRKAGYSHLVGRVVFRVRTKK